MMKSLFARKKPLIGFVTGGDGGKDYCVACCLQLIEGGVDILELGMPFSDPVADGPVIQQASERALAQGTDLTTLLDIAREIRKTSDIPLVLFSYFNPLLQQDAAFLSRARAAGFNAVLIVDLPCAEDSFSLAYFQTIRAADLVPIFLASPSTDDKRLSMIASQADGFIYYACRKGTTGARTSLPADIGFHLERIRSVTSLPIAVGFGIADRESAQAVLQQADGVVVGSAFVSLMAERAPPHQLKTLALQLYPGNPI